jgi:hypothetical protein
MPADNCFTHHHNHHQDTRKEAEGEEVEEVEEMAEVDYLLQQDQDYSHPMEEPQTLTNSWAVSQRRLQETGQKLSPSSLSGSYTVGSMQTMQQSKTSTRKPCYSSPTSKETWFVPGS